MGPWRFLASADDADTDKVRAVSPLAADLFLECGPVRVPIGVSATAEAALERQDNEPARVLRSFLQNNPWEGMGSVTPERWMVLAHSDETIVVGQRRGAIGLGPVVTMSRRDICGELGDRFRPAQQGGCRPVLLDQHDQHDVDSATAPRREQPEPSFRARVEARAPLTVRVSWMSDQNLSGIPHRAHAHTEVLETADAVHFLLVSAPNPDFRPARPGFAEVGTGYSGEASFELAAPLGHRMLFSDYGAPSTQVLVVHDNDAP